MNAVLPPWANTTSTAGGVSGLIGIAVAVATGQVTWQAALPLIIAALAAVLYPQNPAVVAPAQDVVTDLEKLVAAYRLGLTHGATSAPNPSQAAAPAA